MSENEAVAFHVAAPAVPSAGNHGIYQLGEWYAAEHERLYRFAYLLTRDAGLAEDLVQDAFIRIARTRRRADEAGLPAYARRTIINLLRNNLRRRSIERRVLQQLNSERPPASHDPDSALDVRRALLTLSIPDRASLALRYYEGRSDPEIAAVLGVTEAAAKKRVQRAQQRLRDVMKEEQ